MYKQGMKLFHKMKTTQRKISNTERHIRWNWEQSRDNPETARYHFVIVDDRDREGILNQILEQLGVWGGALEPIRSVEDKVAGSEFRYLFRSYDVNQRPDMIDWTRLGTSGERVKQDRDLRERQKGSIENYVEGVYEGS